VEIAARKLTPLDRLYLQRTYELAARGVGSTSPNPPVGAVVVRDGRLVGEGYHRRAGSPHAETNALAQAGSNARGATLYVSLEPCRHVGRTPPCTRALIEAGVARVVAGTRDPSEHGGGAAELKARGVDVTIADDPAARDLVEIFAGAMQRVRPYVALKMAASIDGFVASRPNVSEQLSSDTEQRYVRELRTAYDAVMIGAGTVRIDDPQLTVRPAHNRLRPYARVVACQSETISARSRVFAPEDGYARTIVLAPAGLRDRFDELAAVADVVYVGATDARRLDPAQALTALRTRGLFSVLCEGGPRLAAALIAARRVDRIYWAIAPRFLGSDRAVSVLSGADLNGIGLHVDRLERLGPDVLISATLPPSHPAPVEG
jgi:diaminohydroxyphosphoribosylaminopyrimidine deaminase / 5-amino-6-(5-phosphoribosylamino)uracil reductase